MILKQQNVVVKQVSCKHVRALCYAVAEFCKSGQVSDFLICTEKLQEWNVPRHRKVAIIPVLELGSCKEEILKKEMLTRCPVLLQYDPCPSMQSPDTALLEIELGIDNECHARDRSIHCLYESKWPQ